MLRNSVATGLADLQLITEIVADEQLYQMFRETTHPELEQKKYAADLIILIERLLRAHGETELILREDVLWKADLAEKIVNMCFTFFKSHDMISSSAHKRTIDEAQNLIATEIVVLGRKSAGEIKRDGKRLWRLGTNTKQ